MADNRYLRSAKPFSYKDIISQYWKIKRKYINAHLYSQKGIVDIFVQLHPTEESPKYTIKITAKKWNPTVNVFVTDPDISNYAKGKNTTIPHTYPDGSICLYLPGNHEWTYYDSWAETLIPWTSLWLYYYEIWLLTGEWMGGGAHPRNNDEKKKR